MSARPLAWLTLALVGLAGPVHAQLKNCANLNANPGDYKIVLDDFSFASDAAQQNADLAALRDRLQFNLNVQLDVLKASARQLDRSLQVPMRPVVCAGRQPSLDGSEFTAALAERLSDGRVVVEMWGTLDMRAANGGVPAPSALIGYAIPPVKHYLGDAEVPAIHLLAYPKTGAAQSVQELENLPELPAFALVGLGTKALRANRYDLAVWAFTRAAAGITDAQLAGSNSDLDSLLAYVEQAACTTRQRAIDDQSYTGALRLVPARDCGVER